MWAASAKRAAFDLFHQAYASLERDLQYGTYRPLPYLIYSSGRKRRW